MLYVKLDTKVTYGMIHTQNIIHRDRKHTDSFQRLGEREIEVMGTGFPLGVMKIFEM